MSQTPSSVELTETESDVHQQVAKTEDSEVPSITQQHYYAGPVSSYDLSHASNVQLTAGDQRTKGCLSNENLSARIHNLNEVFVDVPALDRIKQLLKRYGHVTICGAPGDGKTSIALMVCQAYQKKHYETLFVDQLEDFDINVLDRNETNLLLVFDDIFGSMSFSCNLEKLQKLFRELNDIFVNNARSKNDETRKSSSGKTEKRSGKVKHNLRVIFTSRTYNLNEGCSQFFLYKSSLFNPETIIDLTKEGLTPNNKVNILSSFKKWNKMCDVSDEDIRNMIHLQSSMFGFPFICKLYFTTPKFQMHAVNFFRQPVTYLRGDLDHIVQECSSRSAAIILLILCGGKLDLVDFQRGTKKDKSIEELFLAVKDIIPSCTRTSIGKEIKNFKGTYCSIEQQTASFSHPAIYDAAACAFGNLNIILLLEHCSLRFMFERVRLDKSTIARSPGPDDVTNMIYIDDGLYSLVVSRLVEGIKQRYFSMTINHPVLCDDEIVSSVLTELMEDLPAVIKEKDKDTERCFLYWATFSPAPQLFAKALDLTVRMIQESSELSDAEDDSSPRNKNDLNEALLSCVQNDKLLFLQQLTELLIQLKYFDVNCKTNENKTLLMMAAEACHLDVFDFLLQKDADPTLKGAKGKNCLHVSSETGNQDISKAILDKFPNLIDVPDDDGHTPAMICAEMGHVQLLEILITREADLECSDTSAWNCLHMACMEGHAPVVKYLLSLKKSYLDINRREGLYNQTPVMLAAEGSQYDVYELLVSEGADVSLTDYDNKDCLMFACESGSIPIVKHLLSLNLDVNRRGGFSNETAIMLAAERGHLDVFKLLESKGADLSLTDKYNRDCLMWACVGGNLALVKRLLSLNLFDINEMSGLYNNTPISMAAAKGHHDVYKFLLSKGADLTLSDKYNRNILTLACVGGDMSIVRHLLSLKTFDINERGGLHNRSPVMVAAENGHYNIFSLFVSEGADMSLTDKDNRDCLMWACVGGNESIVKHLLSLKTFDINREAGPYNQTPQAMAASRGHYKVCRLFSVEEPNTETVNYRRVSCDTSTT